MSADSHNGHKASDETAPPAAAKRRRTPWALVVVAALFVVVPFAYWYGTWFGRGLSDEQIEKYLGEHDNPRHVQHALSQIAERAERGSPDAERWMPRVVEAAASASPDVRMTAAWVMGLRHGREDFRAALLRLLEDPEPIVRRNAALALVRFGDARCRPELLAMLRPLPVTAPVDGTPRTVLTAGTPVKRESLLALLETEGGGGPREVRSPIPGTVAEVSAADGRPARAGERLYSIAPDAAQARDALIGLYYFGAAEDLPDIERYAAGVEGMPDEVKKQAAATAEAVRRRASQGS